MSRFRPIDRDTPLLLPSVQEWLPEGHLARYGQWKWSKDWT
jgi:hypothetical protein